MDLLIEDQLLRPSPRAGKGMRKPSPVGWPPMPGSDATTLPAADTAATATVPLSPATSMGPTPDPTAVSRLTPIPETTTALVGLAEEGTSQLPAALDSTVMATATESMATATGSLPTATTAVPSPAVATTAGTLRDMTISPSLESSPGSWEQASTPATPVSPTIPATPKQALEEEDIRNIIGEYLRVLHRSSCMRGGLSVEHLDLVTGGMCHGGGGWIALYWGTSFTHLLTLEPTVVSS